MSCCYSNFKVGFYKLFSQKQINFNVVCSRTFAARKGYRELAKKKKVKTVIQKQAWIPHNLRKKDDKVSTDPLRSSEHKKLKAFDDVWFYKSYAWRVYDFKEAIQCLRETHHPTTYNAPDTQLNLFFELDMTTAKPNKFVDKFNRMAILPHVFEQDGLLERSILVFCKTPEQKDEAQSAGANLVGGVEIIKEIEKGKIVLPDFRFVIAHPTILPEMVTIRGLLKKRFPTIKSGTLGPNLGELVTQFKNGVEYSCIRDEKELDYGKIECTVGRLNMEVEQLEDNLTALINDINQMKPKRPGPFITRLLMTTPYTVASPFVERLKIDLTPYLQDEEVDDGSSSDEEEPLKVKM